MLEIDALSPAIWDLLPQDTVLDRIATGFVFTEGPLWDPRSDTLYFSDIPANRIYCWREGSAPEVFREPSGKSNGLTWDLQGRLLACEHLNRRVSLTHEDGSIEAVAGQYRGGRLNSPNDLVVHSSGALYFSDPPYGIQSAEFGEIAEADQPLNGLYLLRPADTEPTLLARDFDRPNGMAFSPDETYLYVADTPRYHVRRFQVLPDGKLAGGDVFVEFEASRGAGRPDGMKVDRRGNLWTTGPGGLWVVAPDGTVLAHLQFPERTANCAWGDAGWQSLYVTATSSVYRLRTLTEGIPSLR